jgi:hypothetical protein
MKKAAYRGKVQEAYERGYDHGVEHATYCDMTRDQYMKAVDDDTLGEILGDIIDNFRQFSPFEFLAAEFNRARNSEARWKAYDEGEYQGWLEGLEKRFGIIADFYPVDPKTGEIQL